MLRPAAKAAGLALLASLLLVVVFYLDKDKLQ
jgi:hypothetical protein